MAISYEEQSEQPSNWPTPLEAAGFTRFSRSQEITDYCFALSSAFAEAKVETWGYSVKGKPITALHIRRCEPSCEPLRVVLIGSQHGASEAAGGEALLVIARQLLENDLGDLLDALEFYILPNANPDGRDADSSRNANDINLNRDYILLSQPESRAIDRALARIKPHVVLDAHESAALKRKSLGLEGYMTEFQAQLDFANNPGISADVQNFCEHSFLNPLLESLNQSGLHAQRYIKEIGSTTQPLTHGGVTARIFRNKAGLGGALSFLLETRMDPKDGRYDSFRNIRVRRGKQHICLRLFLRQVMALAAAIKEIHETHQTSRRDIDCILHADYILHPHEPRSQLPLRIIETQTITHVEFVNHRHLRICQPIPRPVAYIVTEKTELFAHFLSRHSIVFERLGERAEIPVVGLKVLSVGGAEEADIEVESCATTLRVNSNALMVPLDQPSGLLIPQLLEPQSTGSLFAEPRIRGTICVGKFLSAYRYY